MSTLCYLSMYVYIYMYVLAQKPYGIITQAMHDTISIHVGKIQKKVLTN